MRYADDQSRKLDTVVGSRILGDAARIAAWSGQPVVTHAGRPCVRLDCQAMPALEFVPDIRDWRPYDQLVAVLSTANVPVSPNLQIHLDSRTEGLDVNDSLGSGRSEETCLDGRWGECLFPWENFLIFGMGQLVYPVQTIRLNWQAEGAPAFVWLSELRLERRSRAEGPRLTDRGLGGELSDGLDGSSLLAHLRRRERPRHPFEASERQSPASDGLIRQAEDICRHHIGGYDVGNPVNWRINPNGYLEWMHALNRHGWINTLASAYLAGGDVRFVGKLDELWLDWIKANPEPIGHNGGGDPAWETLSTAVRIYSAWLRVFFLLLDDPHFRDTTRIEILKSLHGHAEHLMAHKGYSNNWLIVESRALFMLGMLFPEFKRASAWLREGGERLEAELARQVWPDGADWEIAPGYHIMACQGFLEPLELARLNGHPMPPLFETRLPATFEYVAGMTRPDGTLPSLNDSGGWQGGKGGNYLKLGARLFNRPDLRLSPEGPYAGTSRSFPDAGLHIFASGTGFQALWSLFDGGRAGASHCHDDALSVEFFAFGKPFIVDPGITGYMQDPWTQYYRGSAAHNTLLVNGAGQTWSGAPHEHRTASARERVKLARGDIAEAVRAVYDGNYRGQPDGIRHTRMLLFIRGRCWVLFDEVAGEGALELEARFQFVPLRLTLDSRRHVFRTQRQNLPNMELRPLKLSGRMRLGIATGETSPVGGWVSNGEDQPAPQARIHLEPRQENEPLRLITVVYPFAEGVGSGLKTRLSPDPDRPDGVCLELRHADGARHRIVHNWSDGNWSCIAHAAASSQ